MLVILCPGQGSQKPGFMQSWLELDAYKTDIERFSETVAIDLRTHGTISDEETIRDTAIAQPLIVAASLASASLLDLAGVAGVAGHSVGEIAAAAISGILADSQAMQLVGLRANAMAKAAANSEPTGMAAILGGEESLVLAALSSLNLTPANYNGSGQIVAAGSKAAISELQATGIDGAKVIPLSVAGAFHSKYMQPAVSELQDYASNLSVADPKISIWSNQNGQQVTSGREFLDLLVGQVASPVRWDLCMKAMVSAGITAVIEVSPAGTLAGLAKRGMPGVEIVALREPTDISVAQELINRFKSEVK